MPEFSTKDIQLTTDLLTLIALKLLLLTKSDNERKIRQAAISIHSAAEFYINNENLRPVVNALKDSVIKAVNSETHIKMAADQETLKRMLGEFDQMLQQKTMPLQTKAICTFVYRFAYKLAGIAGKEFANIGRNVSAEDAETLLLVKEILHIQE